MEEKLEIFTFEGIIVVVVVNKFVFNCSIVLDDGGFVEGRLKGIPLNVNIFCVVVCWWCWEGFKINLKNVQLFI